MTRLAHGGPEMGAGMLATNAPNVAAELNRFRVVIDGWIEVLESWPAGADEEPPAGNDSLIDRLEAARRALDQNVGATE
jgi:hypothetical protein